MKELTQEVDFREAIIIGPLLLLVFCGGIHWFAAIFGSLLIKDFFNPWVAEEN